MINIVYKLPDWLLQSVLFSAVRAPCRWPKSARGGLQSLCKQFSVSVINPLIIPDGPKKRPELCVTITARILYGAKFPLTHF